MAATLNTTQFLLSAARDAMSVLRRNDGDRSTALKEFLAAETNEDRDNVVAEHGSALVRKALRVAALSFSKDEEVANVFWTLRDMVDEDGFIDEDDTAGDDDVIEAEVDKFNAALSAA